MGRKQKLRQDRRDKKATAKKDPPSVTTTTTTTTTNALSLSKGFDATVVVTHVLASTKDPYESKLLDGTFPKSDHFVRGMKLNPNRNILTGERLILLLRGSIEHGCVHDSLYGHAQMMSQINGGTCFHLSTPWCLEGAIRGSVLSKGLLQAKIYPSVEPMSPIALIFYWTKIFKEISWLGKY
jgi:hypothetical protein